MRTFKTFRTESPKSRPSLVNENRPAEFFPILSRTTELRGLTVADYGAAHHPLGGISQTQSSIDGHSQHIHHMNTCGNYEQFSLLPCVTSTQRIQRKSIPQRQHPPLTQNPQVWENSSQLLDADDEALIVQHFPTMKRPASRASMTHRGSAMTISATSSTPAWNELFRVKFSRKQNDSSTEASTASGQANLPSLRRCNAFRGKKPLERNEDVRPRVRKSDSAPSTTLYRERRYQPRRTSDLWKCRIDLGMWTLIRPLLQDLTSTMQVVNENAETLVQRSQCLLGFGINKTSRPETFSCWKECSDTCLTKSDVDHHSHFSRLIL